MPVNHENAHYTVFIMAVVNSDNKVEYFYQDCHKKHIYAQGRTDGFIFMGSGSTYWKSMGGYLPYLYLCSTPSWLSPPPPSPTYAYTYLHLSRFATGAHISSFTDFFSTTVFNMSKQDPWSFTKVLIVVHELCLVFPKAQWKHIYLQ